MRKAGHRNEISSIIPLDFFPSGNFSKTGEGTQTEPIRPEFGEPKVIEILGQD